MKLLTILGFLPLFSASPFHSMMMTDSLISSLEAAASDHSAALTIERIFNNNNTCLNNMDEAIDALRESWDLIVAAEGELKSLKLDVEILEEKKGETEVLRGVAAIFRTLQDLVEKLYPSVASSKVCSTSPEKTFDYLRGLAIVLHEFSYDNKVAPNKHSSDLFYKSGNILSALVTFLSQLQVNSREFKSFCFPTKDSTMRGLRALGNMMDNLADLFSAVGNVKTGEEIREGKVYTDNIVNQIPFLNDLNVGFHDCTIKDMNGAAQTLEDLADLIDDVGIERLSKDLGIDIKLFYI